RHKSTGHHPQRRPGISPRLGTLSLKTNRLRRQAYPPAGATPLFPSYENPPLHCPVPAPWFASVAILTYHHIGICPPEQQDHRGLYVEPEQFRAQLAWLQQRGYQAVSLDAVAASI